MAHAVLESLPHQYEEVSVVEMVIVILITGQLFCKQGREKALT